MRSALRVLAGMYACGCADPGSEPDLGAYPAADAAALADGAATSVDRVRGDARHEAGYRADVAVDPPDAAPPPEPCGAGDPDGDGYGEGEGCAGPDCDEENAAVHPGAIEACNGLDEDCDGRIDEGLNQSACGVGACRTLADNCVGGRPQACVPGAPQPEVCNGLDDDCDGLTDEGAGAATCGVGLCERHADCADGVEGACAPGEPVAEACDGQDNDCDGSVDNGFRAVTHSTGYGVLRTHHDACDGGGERIGPGCNAAMHRFCVAQGCTTSGFGPVENSGDGAAVTCVAAGTDRQVAFAVLATHHDGCDGNRQRIGPECNAAIHRYCRSEGFESGFGPIESGPDAVTVTCLASGPARVIESTYGALSGFHGPCNQGNYIGPDCNAAIHRFCGAQGATSGFGPVEHSGDTAVVVCVWP